LSVRKTIVLATALVIGACNPVAQLNTGEEKVEEFQQVYSAGDFDRLYSMTAPLFRETTSREDFQDLVDMLQLRLGDVQSSTRQGFNVNANPQGTFTTVTMQTTFDLGVGMETYIFHGEGEDMRLAGWNVNSDRLMFTVDDLKEAGNAVEVPGN
jgi:hypothetical protein